MPTRLTLAILMLATVASALACFTPEERVVTYENATQLVLTVVSDESELATLKPGERREFAQRKNFLPDHVQAYDEEGNLLFDEVITWEDLEASDFRVLIR
jgi:hypothetical protein